MSLIEYRLHIASATSAAELHEIRGLAQFDRQLNGEEKRAVGDAVNNRFAKLNRVAVGPQNPRWK